MPSFNTFSSSKPLKMLFIGDSGSGKTGALASLAEAGFKLRILDFDNGLDFLYNLIKTKPNADAILNRVAFQTLTDKLRVSPSGLIPDGVPKAFAESLKLLTHWKTPEEDLGPISTWGKDCILVIDSLTFMSSAAFRYVEVVNKFKDPRQTFGVAQDMIENTLGLLYSDEIKCNVIVNSHITFVELDSGLTKGYPSSIGKALGPKIPRYFNTLLEAKTKGTGMASQHVILTKPDGMIELKSSVPNAPAEFKLETGLAEYFKLAGVTP